MDCGPAHERRAGGGYHARLSRLSGTLAGLPLRPPRPGRPASSSGSPGRLPGVPGGPGVGARPAEAPGAGGPALLPGRALHPAHGGPTRTRPARPGAAAAPPQPGGARPRSWRRWAIAAAVLLAFTGVCVPAHRAREGYTDAHRVVAEHEEAVANARAAVEVAQQELKEAVTQRDEKIAQIQHEIKARE